MKEKCNTTSCQIVSFQSPHFFLSSHAMYLLRIRHLIFIKNSVPYFAESLCWSIMTTVLSTVHDNHNHRTTWKKIFERLVVATMGTWVAYGRSDQPFGRWLRSAGFFGRKGYDVWLPSIISQTQVPVLSLHCEAILSSSIVELAPVTWWLFQQKAIDISQGMPCSKQKTPLGRPLPATRIPKTLRAFSVAQLAKFTLRFMAHDMKSIPNVICNEP